MENLIFNSIDWNNITTADGRDASEVGRVKIKEYEVLPNGYLSLLLQVNFIIPDQEEEHIREAFKREIKGLPGVNFAYEYEYPLIQDEKSVIGNLLPKIIQAVKDDDSVLGESINPDYFDLSGNKITLRAFGQIACERLNGEEKGMVKTGFSRWSGKNYDVEFVNDTETYSKAMEEQKEQEEKEIAEIIQFSNKLAEERKQNAPKSPVKNSGDGKSWRGRDRSRNLKAKGNIIMGGKELNGKITPLNEVSQEEKKVTTSGWIFDMDGILIKNGSMLLTMGITDKEISLPLKTFISTDKYTEVRNLLKAGDYVKVHGEPQLDRRDLDLFIMIDGIEKVEIESRKDRFDGPHRVELHCHTKMSDMDGLNNVADMVNLAASWDQPAIAITDHGVVQSFPDAAKAAKTLKKETGKDIKIIYGMEGYVFDDKDCHLEDGTIDHKKKETNHIILLARSQEGVKSLYKIVSKSHIEIPKSLIEEYRDGLIVGSACEAGEVFRAITSGAGDRELDKIASFYDYLEIQPLINNRFMIENGSVLSEEELKEFNRRVLACGDRLGKMTVATTDAHYDEPEAAIYRRIVLAGRGFKDAENGQGLYLRTTDEMIDEFSYLGEDRAYEVVVENTNKIANMIDEGVLPVPDKKFPPQIDGAKEKLFESCMEKAHAIYGDPLPPEIEERLNIELESIISNGYAVLYRAAQMLVEKSLSDGYLVGSRGSVGSSFAATMAGITEVNPLEPHYLCPKCKHLEWGDMEEYDCGVDMPPKNCPVCGEEMDRDGFTIPFATFLGFEGDKEPDIDLNFAGEYQQTIHKYVGNIFGDKNIYKAGTVSTVQEKTARGYVRKYMEDIQRSVNQYEIGRLAKGCEGVKRTTGQHPGGIVIVPDNMEIYDFCPVQRPANKTNVDIITTHFDYHKIDGNLLKLDLLGHNVPSMIRHLQDMTGVDPLHIDLTDRKVLSIFNGIEALDIKDEEYPFVHGTYGIPEFGTVFVRGMLDDIHPERFADLVRISGFSHGTDVWRNNAQDYIREGVATMKEVISTRDDIMNYLILKGLEKSDAFTIMEKVRKNQELTDEELDLMEDNGVPQWYVDSCIKIKYMFPRAHAVAYTMMSFRMAWYKVYYPREFYAAHFSSEVSDFNAEVILKGKRACLEKLRELERFVQNATRETTTTKQESEILVLEAAYEMYARGYEFAPPRLGESRAGYFTVDKDGKVLLPFDALNGVGAQAAKAIEEAYAEAPFSTVEDAVSRAKLNKTAVEVLRAYGVLDGLPEEDQMDMFFLLGDGILG